MDVLQKFRGQRANKFLPEGYVMLEMTINDRYSMFDGDLIQLYKVIIPRMLTQQANTSWKDVELQRWKDIRFC